MAGAIKWIRGDHPNESSAFGPLADRGSGVGSANFFEVYRQPDEAIILRFHRVADFIVRFGVAETVVESFPAPGAHEDIVRHLEINQVLPLVMCEHGHEIYHGSAVALGEHAVGFLGKSGMGKSTLAAALALARGNLLTDDALHLSRDEECRIFAAPSDTPLRLWPKTRDALFGPYSVDGVPIGYSQKAYFARGHVLHHCDEPRELRVVYFLDNSGAMDVSIQPLSKAKAMIGWVSNAFIIDRSDRAALATRARRAARLATTIPAFALDFPRDFTQINDLLDAISDHTMQVVSDSEVASRSVG